MKQRQHLSHLEMVGQKRGGERKQHSHKILAVLGEMYQAVFLSLFPVVVNVVGLVVVIVVMTMVWCFCYFWGDGGGGGDCGIGEFGDCVVVDKYW